MFLENKIPLTLNFSLSPQFFSIIPFGEIISGYPDPPFVILPSLTYILPVAYKAPSPPIEFTVTLK